MIRRKIFTFRDSFQCEAVMGPKVRQWIASLTCNLSVAMTGTCFVWTAPLMVRFLSPESPLPMTSTDRAWITSFIEAGEFASTIPAGLLADRYGRKKILQISGPLTFIGWVLTATTRSIWVLFLVRFIHGIAVAIAFTVAPMYLAEVAEPKMRGLMGGQFQSMWYLGCLYAYVSGPYLSYNNYVYVCAIVPLVSIILFFYIPESPYYYLMINNEEKSIQSLQWLRGKDDIKNEYSSIKSTVENEMKQKGNWKDLFATKKDRKSFFIVQFVCMIKYLGGLTPLIIYVSQTFDEELGDLISGDVLTIIFGLILFLATVFSALMSDKVGRKPLLIISTVGSAFFNAVVAIIFYLDGYTSIDVSSYKWITFVSVVAFPVISNIGLGPLMQTIQAEYFPSHTRGIGGGITETIAALCGLISIIQYQYVSEYIGNYMNFVIFSIICTIGSISFCFLITETAGKSLGQIQEAFEKKTAKKEQII